MRMIFVIELAALPPFWVGMDDPPAWVWVEWFGKQREWTLETDSYGPVKKEVVCEVTPYRGESGW